MKCPHCKYEPVIISEDDWTVTEYIIFYAVIIIFGVGTVGMGSLLIFNQ